MDGSCTSVVERMTAVLSGSRCDCHFFASLAFARPPDYRSRWRRIAASAFAAR